MSYEDTTPAVHVTGLKKSYGRIHAIRDISLQIPKGCIYGVVGPNGAGKTTLFSVLCGYIQADGGEVLLHGSQIGFGRSLPILVATYPQDALMLEGLSVKRHLTYYAELSGFAGEAAVKEAARVLHMVKLPEVWDRSPKKLSHGQRKRIGLAQAFIGEPDIIILDEPTAGLDPVAAREIRAAIRLAAADRTAIISSHDLDELQDLCSEVAILDKGVVVRVDHMSNLIQAGGKVSFKLAERPSNMVLEALNNLLYVRDVAWDAPDARLRVECDSAQINPAEASGQLVQFLLSHNVPFSDMQVGQRLVDVVRDETSR